MPSTRLGDCDPKLAEAFTIGKLEFEQEHPGYTVIVTCTKRSVEEQQELFAQGRTKPGQIVTHIDGVVKKSNHNHDPAKALDFAVVFGGKIVWNDTDAFTKAAAYFKKHGASWGGDWRSFKDLPHIEVS